MYISKHLTLFRVFIEFFDSDGERSTRWPNQISKVTDHAHSQSKVVGEILAALKQVAEIAKKNVDNASSHASMAEELSSLAQSMVNILNEKATVPSVPALERHDIPRRLPKTETARKLVAPKAR